MDITKRIDMLLSEDVIKVDNVKVVAKLAGMAMDEHELWLSVELEDLLAMSKKKAIKTMITDLDDFNHPEYIFGSYAPKAASFSAEIAELVYKHIKDFYNDPM